MKQQRPSTEDLFRSAQNAAQQQNIAAIRNLQNAYPGIVNQGQIGQDIAEALNLPPGTAVELPVRPRPMPGKPEPAPKYVHHIPPSGEEHTHKAMFFCVLAIICLASALAVVFSFR